MKSNEVTGFGEVETTNAVSNLVDVLELNLLSNSRKFSKVGGRTVSARQVFDQFANRQRKAINDSRESKGLGKLSQYDAIRQIASKEHKYSGRDFYAFGDKLCDILNVSGRPNDDEIRASLTILAKDWADDPSNHLSSWDELQELAPSAMAEGVESAIETV